MDRKKISWKDRIQVKNKQANTDRERDTDRESEIKGR